MPGLLFARKILENQTISKGGKLYAGMLYLNLSISRVPLVRFFKEGKLNPKRGKKKYILTHTPALHIEWNLE